MTTVLKSRFCAVTAAALALVIPLSMPAAAQKAPGDKEEQIMARDLLPALKPLYDLLTGNDKSLPVEAWVDRKSRTYKVGEAVRIMVRPKKDAHITVLNVGSSGRVAVVFPNHFQRESLVRAGHTVSIPAANAKWQMNVGGPAGVDLIKVIASPKPLTVPELEKLAGATAEQPVLTLGRSAEAMARDLTPVLKPATPDAGGLPGVRNILIRIRQ